jgi:beta-glucosidase
MTVQGEWEGEGNDRHTMSLPPHIDTLISRVASSCTKTVVVNLSGTPVAMPWAADVPAILQAWYGGNEAGNGIADVLFGDFNPSGKLPFSWPRKIQDDPTYLNFGSTQGRCLYGEDIYVGYRYFDRIGRAPQWAFGHGLSYSSFELDSLCITTFEPKLGEQEPKRFHQTSVFLNVRNTSKIAGAEILQLYIEPPPSSTMARPAKELHGFEKVFLEPGEEKRGKIDIDSYAMSYWDESEEKWCIERGTYKVIVATSSSNATEKGSSRLEGFLEVDKTRYWLGL